MFFADGISWDPFFVSITSSGQVSNPMAVNLRSLFVTHNYLLDPRLNSVWTDAQEFCAIMNLARVTGRRMRAGLFQELMISLQYRLVYLDPVRQGMARENLHEAVRLSTLAFTTSVFLRIAGIDTRYPCLASQLKTTLSTLKPAADEQHSELRLWLLVIAAISLFRTRNKVWLKETITETLRQREMLSWQNMKAIMKKHLWIDMIHDTEGQKLFDLCVSDKTPSNQSKR